MIITKANFIHFFGAIMNVERTKVMIITEILLFFSLFNIFSFNPPLFVRLKREPISYETTPDEIKE